MGKSVLPASKSFGENMTYRQSAREEVRSLKKYGGKGAGAVPGNTKIFGGSKVVGKVAWKIKLKCR